MTVQRSHEAFCLDSFMDKLFWWDDFLGDQLKDEWREVGTGSAAVIDLQTGGIVRIATGVTGGDQYIVDWNNIRGLHVTKRVCFESRAKLNQITWEFIRFGLSFDTSNNIMFYFVNSNANWYIECENGGALTSLDSGVVADTLFHIFRFECHIHGSNHVHFYIDGVETANSPITTNVPDGAGDYLQPWFYIRSREGGVKSMDIDYVGVRQDI